jgi:hypothetical protein
MRSDAMHSDLSQYGQKGMPEKADVSQRDSIREVVTEISGRVGSDNVGLLEFQARQLRAMGAGVDECSHEALRQMMCGRMPRIYLPAKFIFDLLHRYSKEAHRVTSGMTPDAIKARWLRLPRELLCQSAQFGAHLCCVTQALIISIGRMPHRPGRLGFDSDQAATRVYRPVRRAGTSTRKQRLPVTAPQALASNDDAGSLKHAPVLACSHPWWTYRRRRKGAVTQLARAPSSWRLRRHRCVRQSGKHARRRRRSWCLRLPTMPMERLHREAS